VKATKVNAGLAESNGSLLPGLWRDSLHVTCGLTACTPGSAPGPTSETSMGKLYLLPLNDAIAATRDAFEANHGQIPRQSCIKKGTVLRHLEESRRRAYLPSFLHRDPV